MDQWTANHIITLWAAGYNGNDDSSTEFLLVPFDRDILDIDGEQIGDVKYISSESSEEINYVGWSFEYPGYRHWVYFTVYVPDVDSDRVSYLAGFEFIVPG